MLKFLFYSNLLLIFAMNRLINLNKLIMSFSKLNNPIKLTNSFSTFTYLLSSKDYKLIRIGDSQANQRFYFENVNSNKLVSPFHDIPLYQNNSNKILNMVVEIPRYSNAKMEINKNEKLNPIIQDSKNNKLRYVNNVYPYHGYIFNYGALPQTWEDPNQLDETTGCIGDNDPLDVCEIGSLKQNVGSIIQVKPLGSLGLIDEGEADWKVIVIDINDPLAVKLNDVNDVLSHMPGLLESMVDWFRVYKTPTGKPANKFALNKKNGKEFFDRDFTLKIIEHDHKSWLNLVNSNTNEKISILNTSLNNTNTISSSEARMLVDNESKSLKSLIDQDDSSIDKVYYINRNNLN